MKRILTFEEARREAQRQMKLHLVRNQGLSKRLVKNLQGYLDLHECKDVKHLIKVLVDRYVTDKNIVLASPQSQRVVRNKTVLKINKAVLFFKYEKKCMKCGSVENIEVDHIYPVSIYPQKQNDLNNLQLLCKSCNLEKSNKYIMDYRPVTRK
jgi:5-methylcytosine-specific restriction endonuclease McrA